MTFQLAAFVRNPMLNAAETAVGTAPVLKIRTGAVPATPETADAGTVLATMTLPSDWLDDADAGEKELVGTWQDTAADAAGTAGHARIYQSDGTTTAIQMPVCMTSELGTGDIPADGEGYLVLGNTNIQAGQPISISAFAINIGA